MSQSRGSSVRKPETPEARAKRLANLKPFKKGQSGNPKGLPKGYWTKAREAAEKADVFGYLVRNVLGENPRATEDVRLRSAIELANRAWGKPLDTQIQLRIGEGGDGGTAQLGTALESLARVLTGQREPAGELIEGELVTESVTVAPAADNVAESLDNSDE